MPLDTVKVLRVLPTLGTGGAEQQCLEVADFFNQDSARHGIQVDLATLFGPSSLHTLDLPAGTKWYQLNCHQSAFGILRAGPLLTALAQEYDLVHALLWPSAWAVARGTSRSTPTVVSIHGSAVRSGLFGLKGIVDRMFFRQVAKLGFNSEIGCQALAAYYGRAERDCFVVRNGKRLFPGPWPERNGLFVSARFEYPKRYDVLLDALTQISGQPTLDVSIAGQGTASADFLQEIETRNLGHVHPLGVINDPVAKMAAAKIVALPTDHEGMPNTILEAWSAKAAVIASKVSGVNELVRDGQDGILVENTPEAWASGLQLLLEDKALRASLATAGHQRLVAEFSMERTVADWADLYRGILVK